MVLTTAIQRLNREFWKEDISVVIHGNKEVDIYVGELISITIDPIVKIYIKEANIFTKEQMAVLGDIDEEVLESIQSERREEVRASAGLD